MKVVIVSLTGIASAEPLGPLPDGVRVRVLSGSREHAGSVEALVLPLTRGARGRVADKIYAASLRNAVLRMLVRISPFDRGARFWRVVRRDGRVRDLVADADLLVAGDRDANFTCWQLARRSDIAAVSGYPAGTQEVLKEVAP